MGEHDVAQRSQPERLRAFTRALLEDARALERMVSEGRIERGVQRFGAEQELFLIDAAARPAPLATSVLERLDPEAFTTELGRFNLEANLTPHEIDGTCLAELENELKQRIEEARQAAAELESDVVLCGILPTLERRHLSLDHMTPNPRYAELNRVLKEMRGGDFATYIKGLDELQMRHDNVMLEACNTSFQIHWQVSAEDFAPLYNVAQLITGPVLAAAVNSPVLLQHRLWHETRVALFQQSLDARHAAQTERGHRTRVHFGESWVKESVLEIIREDIARFRSIIARELTEDPHAMLDRGEVPKLQAWTLFNGTVYRWNRPCYGITKLPDGSRVPHLRIENRVLPSGPTPADEVGNAALFFGLMSRLKREAGTIPERLSHDDAKANFMAAARYGLKARFHWLDGESLSAEELMQRLLPLAREGLVEQGVSETDIDHYLGLVDRRVSLGRTGSQWVLDSLAAMGEAGRRDEGFRCVTRAMVERQKEGRPVCEWALAEPDSDGDWRENFRTVSQVMSTELFTVHPEDLVDLAASLMDWEHIRHVPVEDDDGSLVGLVSHRALLRMVGRGLKGDAPPVAVREIMKTDPVTIGPEASTLDALRLMRAKRLSCLPVVRGGKLVGLLTEHDYMEVARELLEAQLEER
ncbi:MAG: CBS domain-containing protein [Planctomycetota bacterium]|jgi:predicted transcriptional regulator